MTEPGRYLVNEIFLSVQGEGVRAGTLNVFVRLARCNLRCAVEPGPRSPGGFDCDTEFESGRWMAAAEIAAACCALWPAASHEHERWIVLTGGEPGLQADRELFAALHASHFFVAIETNGSVRLAWGWADEKEATTMEERDGTFPPRPLDLTLRGFFADWITVSPKVAEHAIRQRWAHEVKYVRGAGQAAPKTAVDALHYLVSPAHDGLALDRGALATCLDIVRTTPPWRLSVQQHKAWGVR